MNPHNLTLKIAAQAGGLNVTAVTRVVQVQDNVGAVRVEGGRWALPDRNGAGETVCLSAESVNVNGRRYRMGVHDNALYVSEVAG